MFRSIALGGGGVRGGIMIGGLAALEKHQPLVFPDGIYGCSVGSILATALAFKIPVHGIRAMFDTDFRLDGVMPSINLTSLTSFAAEKALFTMDGLRETVVRAFENQGIDLRNAVIADAPQKLFILASNLTTRKAVFLTGSVSVLDAICASSCLPFVFHPQIIYNNVYIDGAFYAHNIHKIVPVDCLVFHISRADLTITTDRLKKMSITDYASTIYEASRAGTITENVVWFKNDKIGLLEELTDDQRIEMYSEGFDQASRFLAKRLPEVVG